MYASVAHYRRNTPDSAVTVYIFHGIVQQGIIMNGTLLDFIDDRFMAAFHRFNAQG